MIRLALYYNHEKLILIMETKIEQMLSLNSDYFIPKCDRWLLHSQA
jgi:hypothetical protein